MRSGLPGDPSIRPLPPNPLIMILNSQRVKSDDKNGIGSRRSVKQVQLLSLSLSSVCCETNNLSVSSCFT